MKKPITPVISKIEAIQAIQKRILTLSMKELRELESFLNLQKNQGWKNIPEEELPELEHPGYNAQVAGDIARNGYGAKGVQG